MADRCIPQNVLLIWSLCLTTSSLQQMIGNLTSWRRLYCVLRGGKLFCYYSPEEIEAKVEPALTVSINKVKMIICGFFCLLVFWCLFLFLMIILRVVIFVSRLLPLGLKLLVCKKLCRQSVSGKCCSEISSCWFFFARVLHVWAADVSSFYCTKVVNISVKRMLFLFRESVTCYMTVPFPAVL